MIRMKNKSFFIVTFSFFLCNINQPNSTQNQDSNFYAQISTPWLKKIDITNPNTTEQAQINLCKALEEFGEKKEPIATENLASILSVEMFDILPKYFKTQTISGTYAIAAQCLAGFTDNISELERKQQITLCFDENKEIAQTLENFIKKNISCRTKIFISFYRCIKC